MNKLLPTNEIIGAYLTNGLNNKQIDDFSNDAKSFVKNFIDFDFSSDVNVVENTESDINLVLPYYSAIDTLHASVATDESLENISGGEILITVFACVGVGIATAATFAAGVSSITLSAGIAIGAGVAGAAIGAGVVATSAAAGIQAANGKDMGGNKK